MEDHSWAWEKGSGRAIADNVVLNAGAGGATAAADDIGGVHYPRVKPAIGSDGVATDVVPVSAGLDTTGAAVQAVGLVAQLDDAATATVTENQFAPVRMSSRRALLVEGVASGTAVTVDGSAVTQPVSGTVTANLAAGTNNIGDVDVLTVPAPLSTTGGGTEATALRVTVANDSTGVLSVDDNGGSLTVDGSVSVSGAVDTELPAAAALADNTANPTVPAVGSFGHVWDGTTWDRTPGTSADGVTVNLGANNDVSLNAGTNNIGDVDVLTVPAPLSTTGGGTEATALRVTIANDSTGVVSIDDNAGSLTVDGTVTANQGGAPWSVAGNVAHDSADSGNPIKIGGRADSTFQTAAADGDRVDALFDVYGVQEVRGDHPNKWSYHDDDTAAVTTDGTVQAAPGAGLSVYITDIIFSIGAATASSIFLEEGTTKILGPYYLEAIAGRSLHIRFATPKKCTANTAILVTNTGSITFGIDILGFIAP